MKLAGKVAVVTGGGIGIGRKTALLLAREGVKVAVTDIDKENGQATVKEILAFDGDAIFVSHDVTEQREWYRVLQEVIQTYSRIDMLFNNAGLYQIQCNDQYEEKYKYIDSITDTIKDICKEIKHINSSGTTNKKTGITISTIEAIEFSDGWNSTNSAL